MKLLAQRRQLARAHRVFGNGSLVTDEHVGGYDQRKDRGDQGSGAPKKVSRGLRHPTKTILPYWMLGFDWRRCSHESEAIDLMCQGVDTSDVADAVSKFMSERVAAMCTYMPLTKEVVAAGGLAKSPALIKHLSRLIKQDVTVLDLPEYVGAIGAAISRRAENE